MKSFKTLLLEDSPIFISFVSLNFLPLFSLIHHNFNAWIVGISNFSKHLMRSKMIHVPLMKF